MVASLAVFSSHAAAVPAVGVIEGTKILASFDTAGPGAFTELRAVTGIGVGEQIEDLDYRWHPGSSSGSVPPPALYALTIKPGLAYTARIYRIEIATGVATPIGPGFETNPAGTVYAVDFNPVSDRLRVVNDAEANFRINPDTGALAGKDEPLFEAGEKVSGVAFDRVESTTASTSADTTAFAIGNFADALYTLGGVNQVPTPNGGKLLNGKLLGVSILPGRHVGFDIAPSGTAFATLNPDGFQGLYTVDTGTGAATLVGKLPESLNGLAIVPPPAVAPPAAVADRLAPTVSLAGVKSAMSLPTFLKGIAIRITASEPAGLDAELLAAAKGAKLSSFNLILASTSLSLGAGERRLSLKPSKRLIGKPKKAFKVSLRVTATDAAGNEATATKTIKVKPVKKKKGKRGGGGG